MRLSALYSLYCAAVDRDIPQMEILGVALAALSTEEALARAEDLLERPEPARVLHVNAHTANLAYADPDYRAVLERADLVLNDGKGMLVAARLLGGRFPADLNGNHFGPRLLARAAERGWPVFFLGARAGVAERAAGRLEQRIPGLEVCGVRHGYIAPNELDSVLAGIRASRPRLLYVGLGNPLQERWLDAHLDATGAQLGVGVGAFFDFQAGEVQRAPEWMNRAGVEWLHRLAQEPNRMWRRYLYGNPRFISRVLRQRLAGRAGALFGV